jgi:hypothetical protein
MTGLLIDSELERLKSYMPPGWREQIGPSLTSDTAMGHMLYLQELLSAIGTFLEPAPSTRAIFLPLALIGTRR